MSGLQGALPARWRAAARHALAVSRRPSFREGFRDARPLSIGITAWGVVAGVAMAKSGIPVALCIFMSLVVSAGSSQLAALPLIVGGAPAWVVWATVACVNLRFMVFSYQYRPYFIHLPRRQRLVLSYFMGDTIFAIFLHRYPEPVPEPGQVDYFIGASAINWPAWHLSVLTGIFAGDAIPPQWGLGFAGSMALLALTCSQLRDRATWVAAAVAACAAVAAYAWPLHLNIVAAIAAAIAVGVIAEHAKAARAARA